VRFDIVTVVAFYQSEANQTRPQTIGRKNFSDEHTGLWKELEKSCEKKSQFIPENITSSDSIKRCTNFHHHEENTRKTKHGGNKT